MLYGDLDLWPFELFLVETDLSLSFKSLIMFVNLKISDLPYHLLPTHTYVDQTQICQRYVLIFPAIVYVGH